jgi:hypothetical protein
MKLAKKVVTVGLWLLCMVSTMSVHAEEQRYQEGTCAGWRSISHYMTAGWDT